MVSCHGDDMPVRKGLQSDLSAQPETIRSMDQIRIALTK